MKSQKELIIDRLLEKNEITQDEVLILNDITTFKHLQDNTPFKKSSLNWQEQLANNELERRAEILDKCSCNPKNGGSGVCGCTIGGSFTTMS